MSNPNAICKKTNPTEMSDSMQSRKLLLKLFDIIYDFLGRRQRIHRVKSQVINYQGEISLPHHKLDDVAGSRKVFNIRLAKTICARDENISHKKKFRLPWKIEESNRLRLSMLQEKH